MFGWKPRSGLGQPVHLQTSPSGLCLQWTHVACVSEPASFTLHGDFKITQGWLERWWVSVGENGKDPREGHQFDAATDNSRGGKFLNEVKKIFIIMVLKSRRK